MAKTKFSEEQSLLYSLETWNEAVSPDHPSAEVQRSYLTSLGLSPPWSEALRCKRQCHPMGGWMPALIAARHDPDCWDQIGGIHKIFLREDGRRYEGKPCRMSLGQMKNGRSILWRAKQHLIIAEAVEDALVIHQRLAEIGVDWGCMGALQSAPTDAAASRRYRRRGRDAAQWLGPGEGDGTVAEGNEALGLRHAPG
jgi:hypothetical protein